MGYDPDSRLYANRVQEDEEERKKRLQALRYSPVWYPNMPKPATPQAYPESKPRTLTPEPNKFQQAQELRSVQRSITQQAPENVAKTAKAATDYMERRKQHGLADPLMEWNSLVKALGAEGMDARVQGVYDIYRRYYQPYPAAALVWDLVRSPFSLEQIESMSRYAAPILKNSGHSIGVQASLTYSSSKAKTDFKKDTAVNIARADDLSLIPQLGSSVASGLSPATREDEQDMELWMRGTSVYDPMEGGPAVGVRVGATGGKGHVGRANTEGGRAPSQSVPFLDIDLFGLAAYQEQAKYYDGLTEKWSGEIARRRPELVQRIESATGIARTDSRTFQEWIAVTQRALIRGDIPGENIPEALAAIDSFEEARSRDQFGRVETYANVGKVVKGGAILTASLMPYGKAINTARATLKLGKLAKVAAQTGKLAAVDKSTDAVTAALKAKEAYYVEQSAQEAARLLKSKNVQVLRQIAQERADEAARYANRIGMSNQQLGRLTSMADELGSMADDLAVDNYVQWSRSSNIASDVDRMVDSVSRLSDARAVLASREVRWGASKFTEAVLWRSTWGWNPEKYKVLAKIPVLGRYRLALDPIRMTAGMTRFMGLYAPTLAALDPSARQMDLAQQKAWDRAAIEMGEAYAQSYTFKVVDSGAMQGQFLRSDLAGTLPEDFMTEAQKALRAGHLVEAEVLATMATGTQEDIAALQLKWQQDILDDDKSLLREGYGKELEANGIMTPEWWSVVRTMKNDEESIIADMQMKLLAGGYARGDMEITGSFKKWDENTKSWVEDEEWMKAYRDGMEDWNKWSETARDHPYLYTFLQAVGAPITDSGLRAMWHSITSEGYFYTPLKLMTKAAQVPGSFLVGTLAGLDLYARTRNDPLRAELEDQLIAYAEKFEIRRPLSTPDSLNAAYQVEDPMDIGEAYDLLMERADKQDDKEAKRLVGLLDNDNMIKVMEGKGMDLISTVGNLVGIDQDSIEQWEKDNPDIAAPANMAGLMIAQMLMNGAKGVRRPVPRKWDAFMGDGRATKMAKQVERLLRTGGPDAVGEIPKIIGGSHARIVAQDLARGLYRNVTDESVDIKRVAKEIADIVTDVNLSDVQKMSKLEEALPGVVKTREKDARVFFTKLITDGYDRDLKLEAKTQQEQAAHATRKAKETQKAMDDYDTRQAGKLSKLDTGTKTEYDAVSADFDTRQDLVMQEYKVRMETDDPTVLTVLHYSKAAEPFSTAEVKRFRTYDEKGEALAPGAPERIYGYPLISGENFPMEARVHGKGRLAGLMKIDRAKVWDPEVEGKTLTANGVRQPTEHEILTGGADIVVRTPADQKLKDALGGRPRTAIIIRSRANGEVSREEVHIFEDQPVQWLGKSTWTKRPQGAPQRMRSAEYAQYIENIDPTTNPYVTVDPNVLAKDLLEAQAQGVSSPFLSTKRWAIVSAEKSELDSVKVDQPQNDQRHAALKADLTRMGYNPVETVSADGERSYYIQGITPSDAMILGNKYQQDAVLMNEGWVWTTEWPNLKEMGQQYRAYLPHGNAPISRIGKVSPITGIKVGPSIDPNAPFSEIRVPGSEPIIFQAILKHNTFERLYPQKLEDWDMTTVNSLGPRGGLRKKKVINGFTPFPRPSGRTGGAEGIATGDMLRDADKLAVARDEALLRIQNNHAKKKKKILDNAEKGRQPYIDKRVLNWEKKQAPIAPTLAPLENIIAQRLAGRQRGTGEVLGTHQYTVKEIKEKLAEYYTGRMEPARDLDGTLIKDENGNSVLTKRFYDIAPHLTQPGLKKFNRVAMGIRVTLGNEENWVPGPLRALGNALFVPLMRAPMLKASTLSADFQDRVADFVATYSGSVAHAERWRVKALMTDFSLPSRVRAFEAELQADAEKYVQRNVMHDTPLQKAQRTLGMESTSQLRELGDMGSTQIGTKFSAKTSAELDKQLKQIEYQYQTATTPEAQKAAMQAYHDLVSTAGRVGTYKGGQVTMQTTKAKYMVRLGRDVMWAPIKTLGGEDAYGHALNFSRTLGPVVKARNAVRKFEAAAQTLSTPMRLVSVGSGFVNLFLKHSMADTMRSLADEGLSIFLYDQHKSTWSKSLDALGPEARARVLNDFAAASEGEYHYVAEGGMEYVWTQAKVFDSRGNPTHMEEAIPAIRNIIQDKGFLLWARGGEEALLKWLEAPDGVSWVHESGAYKRVENMWEESGTIGKTQAETLKYAQQLYFDDMVSLFRDYKATTPRLYNSMLDMAKGARPLNSQAIRDALLTAMKLGQENPTIEYNYEKAAKSVTGAMTYLTKAGMTPNRLNRKAVYMEIYSKVYDRLTDPKQGVNPDDAAVIASGVARTRTGQVHFDLSEAMKFEAKNRWYAWFGTKHRLWTTWLMKSAVKYPFYAATIPVFLDWMEERNSDPAIPEYEKHNITVKIGDHTFSANMAPYLWMLSYAQESVLGHFIEGKTIDAMNIYLGTDFMKAPNVFEPSITRLDAPLRAIIDYGFNTKGIEDGDTQAVKDALAKMPAKDAAKIRKAMTAMLIQDGYQMSYVDAYKKVVWGGVIHEFTRLAKPGSTVWRTGEEVELRKLEVQYASLKSEFAREDFLRIHPDYAAFIGAGRRDPDVQKKVADYYMAKTKLNLELEQKINRIYEEDITNTEALTVAYSQYNDAMDQLDMENPEGAADANRFRSEPDELNQAIKYFLPTADPTVMREAFTPPTEDEINTERDRLQALFGDACEVAGIDPNGTGMGTRLLKQRMVAEPLAKFAKTEPDDLTAAQENTKKWIYRAKPSVGAMRQGMYVDTVLNERTRDILMSGLKNGKPDKNNFIFMFLTEAERAYIGASTDPAVMDAWLKVAVAKERADTWLKANGIEVQSKKGQEVLYEVNYVINEMARTVPGFADELDYSLMDPIARMKSIGFGKTNNLVGTGWRDFFDIQERALAYAASIYNKQTKQDGISLRTSENAQTHPEEAAKMRAIHSELVELARRNPAWLHEWQVMGLSLSKFGWYFRLPDNSDLILWSSAAEQVSPEEYEEAWGVE